MESIPGSTAGHPITQTSDMKKYLAETPRRKLVPLTGLPMPSHFDLIMSMPIGGGRPEASAQSHDSGRDSPPDAMDLVSLEPKVPQKPDSVQKANGEKLSLVESERLRINAASEYFRKQREEFMKSQTTPSRAEPGPTTSDSSELGEI